MIYACIADIHGRGSSLVKALEEIEKKREQYPEITVVFLGDYIDRGDENLLVLDSVMGYKKKHPETICVKGNHDEFMIGSFAYDKLPNSSYIKSIHRDAMSMYNIWTYKPNGGQFTFNELYKKACVKNPDLTTMDFLKEGMTYSFVKKYVNFLFKNPMKVIRENIVFSHAPLNREFYVTTKDVRSVQSYDALWNVKNINSQPDLYDYISEWCYGLDKTEKRSKTLPEDAFVNIHGHIHTHEIVKDTTTKTISCANVDDLNVVLVDDTKPFDKMIIEVIIV